MIDPASDLRARIQEEKVGAPVPDNVWRTLVNVGAVARVLAGKQTDDWLTEQIFDLAPHLLRSRADPMLSRRQLGERQALVSGLVASRAAGEDAVRQLRAELFGDGRLLSMDEVGRWISRQQGGSTLWMEIALPDGHSPTVTPGGVGVRPPLTISEARPVVASIGRRLLEYMQPDGWVSRVATAHGTPLDRLRELSEHLATEYGWQRAQATSFALTGKVPLLRAIRLDWTRTGRLLLDVDAGVSPQQLVAAYRTFRRSLVGGRRARALTEKQQRIAEFLAGRPVKESPADRRRAWNRSHPTEAYASNRSHNFKRACENVEQRLLNPIDEGRARDILTELLGMKAEQEKAHSDKQRVASCRVRRRRARRT